MARAKPETLDLGFTNAENFWANGVCTFPIIPQKYHKSIQTSGREKLLAAMKKSVEFKKDAKLFVLGGFAAMGHPTSFHHKSVRRLRKHCAKEVSPILQKFQEFKKIPYKLEVLFDRLMIRKKGQEPGKETFHRDVSDSKDLQKLDYIFGGWVNLDDVPQGFRCCPGTHQTTSVWELQQGCKKKKGFAKIPKAEHADYNKKVKHVVIPPGHGVLFFQHIVHEVYNSEADHDMYRLFTGYRLTQSTNALFNRQRVFDKFEVPRLPSGQMPAMHSSNHTSVWLLKPCRLAPGLLMNFSDWVIATFDERLVEKKTIQSKSDNNGKTYWGLKTGKNRSLLPLPPAMLKEAKFAAYSAEERALYAPSEFLRAVVVAQISEGLLTLRF